MRYFLPFFIFCYSVSCFALEELQIGEEIRATDGSSWNIVETEQGMLTHSKYSETHSYRPTLIAPLDNMQVSRFALVFHWQHVLEPINGGKDEYIVAKNVVAFRSSIQIAADPEFRDVLFEEPFVYSNRRGSSTFYLDRDQREMFDEGKRYFWRTRIIRENPSEESKYSEKELWDNRGSPIFTFTVEEDRPTYDDHFLFRPIDSQHPAFFLWQPRHISIKENIPELLRPYLLYGAAVGRDVYSAKVDDEFRLYLENSRDNANKTIFYEKDYNEGLPKEHTYLTLGVNRNTLALAEYILQKEQELGLQKIVSLNASEVAWRINSSRDRKNVIDNIRSMILLAAKYGKYFTWGESTDGQLMWQAIGATPEIAELMQKYRKYLIVGHKNMMNTRGFISMQQTLGLRLSGYADQNLLHIEPWCWSHGWGTTPSVIHTSPVKHGELRGVKAYPASFYPQQFLVSLTQGVSTYQITGLNALRFNNKRIYPSQLWAIPNSNFLEEDWSACTALPATKNHLFPLLNFIIQHDMIPTKEELLKQTSFVVGTRKERLRTNKNQHSYGDPRIPNQVTGSGMILKEPRPWELYYTFADIIYGFDKTDWFEDEEYTIPYSLYEEYQEALVNYKNAAIYFSEMPCIPKKSQYGWVPQLPQQQLANMGFSKFWQPELDLEASIPILYIEDLSPSNIDASFEEHMEIAMNEIESVSETTPKISILPEKEDVGDIFIRKWGDGHKFVIMNSHENKQLFPITIDGEIQSIQNTDQDFYLNFQEENNDFFQITGISGSLKARQYIVGRHIMGCSEELFLFLDSHYASEPDYQYTEFSIHCERKPYFSIIEPSDFSGKILAKSEWLEKDKLLKIRINNNYNTADEHPNFTVIMRIDCPKLFGKGSSENET